MNSHLLPIFVLSLFQIVWAGTYVAMKLAMTEMPLGLVMIFRYGLTTLFFLIAGQLRFGERFSRREWLMILGIGIVNFSGSPYFQLKALQYTQASDAAVMVAFEPLVLALLAVVLLGERLKKRTLFTFFCATGGVLLLSGEAQANAPFDTARLFGNLLFFGSVIFEAFYTLGSIRLVQKHHPYRIVAWMILFGFLGNLLGNFHLLTPENLGVISAKGWGALFYLSFLATFVCYTGWVVILKKVPVTQAALSLFLQPIFGTILGVLLLREPYGWRNFAGTSLILFSLLAWLLPTLRKRTLRAVALRKKGTLPVETFADVTPVLPPARE